MRPSRSICLPGDSQSTRKMWTSVVVLSFGLCASKSERIGWDASRRLSCRWPSPDSDGSVGRSWFPHTGHAEVSDSVGPHVRQKRAIDGSIEKMEGLWPFIAGHRSARKVTRVAGDATLGGPLSRVDDERSHRARDGLGR